MAESEEKLKSLLMKVKEEHESQFSRSVMSNSLRPPWTAAHQPSLFITNSCCSNSCSHVTDAIQQSHHLFFTSPPAFNLSQNQGLFQWVSSLHQVSKVSASASVLPMNIQDWFSLGLTCWISLQSKGLSRVFSNTTVQKHQFFGAQVSSWSNSHIHTWLLGKPQLWLDGLCQQSNVSAF